MNIVMTMKLNEHQRAQIAQVCGNAEILEGFKPFDPEQMAPVLENCEVMVTFRVPRDLPSRAPRLRWVHLMSAGAEHALDTGIMEQGKVMLTNSSGIHGTTIGEYILASMLAYAHQLHVALRAQSRHQWVSGGHFMRNAQDLRGRTLGIIGYGSIGRETGRVAEAFGMEVLALKRNPGEHADPGWCAPNVGDPEGRIPKRWFGPEQRRELVALSDYIVVTLPLTPHTRHFLGAAEFAVARPGAYVVNVGRGEVIDQNAMIDALKAGRLGGAGLDVVVPEPLDSDSPLWDLENVLLTPHMSGARQGYNDAVFEVFLENLRRLMSGRKLLNLIEPSLGY